MFVELSNDIRLKPLYSLCSLNNVYCKYQNFHINNVINTDNGKYQLLEEP